MITADSWKQILIDTLSELSSREYKERVWLKGQGNEVSSFEESVCNFYDLAIDAAPPKVAREEIGIDENLWKKILSLKSKLDEFLLMTRETPSPREILENVNWEIVRSDASDLLKAILDERKAIEP
jgi:hypothetical protein